MKNRTLPLLSVFLGWTFASLGAAVPDAADDFRQLPECPVGDWLPTSRPAALALYDVLPGTSLPQVCEFFWNDEILASRQLAAVTDGGIGIVASALGTRAAGEPLVVYDPLSIAREDTVEATIRLNLQTTGLLVAVGPAGKATLVQVRVCAGGQLRILFRPATGAAA